MWQCRFLLFLLFFIDPIECRRAVKWICDFIIHQCSRPPPAHSKDLHSSIVAAFQCITTWLTAHTYLLEDKDTLHTILEVVEYGISGTKSQVNWFISFSFCVVFRLLWRGRKSLMVITTVFPDSGNWMFACLILTRTNYFRSHSEYFQNDKIMLHQRKSGSCGWNYYFFKLQGKPGEAIKLKDEKDLKPVSLRVRDAAEALLAVIFEQVIKTLTQTDILPEGFLWRINISSPSRFPFH